MEASRLQAVAAAHVAAAAGVAVVNGDGQVGDDPAEALRSGFDGEGSVADGFSHLGDPGGAHAEIRLDRCRACARSGQSTGKS